MPASRLLSAPRRSCGAAQLALHEATPKSLRIQHAGNPEHSFPSERVYSLAQELMINLGTWQPPNDDAPQLAAEGDEAATAEEGEEEAAARPKPSIKMCGIAAVLLHNYKTQGVLKSPIRAAARARPPRRLGSLLLSRGAAEPAERIAAKSCWAHPQRPRCRANAARVVLTSRYSTGSTIGQSDEEQIVFPNRDLLPGMLKTMYDFIASPECKSKCASGPPPCARLSPPLSGTRAHTRAHTPLPP